MKPLRPPRFPFELLPIVIYGVLLFGGLRVHFDIPAFNFYFVACVSVLPWISLSWAVVFNGGSWKKPTVIFALYVVALSTAMLVMNFLGGGSAQLSQKSDPSVMQLGAHNIDSGRVVVVEALISGNRSHNITVYKDRAVARGLWFRSLIFSGQIYDIGHIDFTENSVTIVTSGKVPETKTVRF